MFCRGVYFPLLGKFRVQKEVPNDIPCGLHAHSGKNGHIILYEVAVFSIYLLFQRTLYSENCRKRENQRFVILWNMG